MILRVNDIQDYRTVVDVGRQFENEVTEVQIDYTEWVQEFGEGTLRLTLRRPGDTTPYPVELSTEDNVATWLLTSTDLANRGSGKAQVTYTIGEQVKKSAVFRVRIGASLDPGEPPDPYESWLDRMEAVAESAQASANEADGYLHDARVAAELAEASADRAAEAFEFIDNNGDITIRAKEVNNG